MKNLIKTNFGTYGFLDESSGIEVTGFLNSLNGIDHYDPKDGRTESIPKAYGFKIIETGGGCTAWHQQFILDGRKVYILITNTDGTSHAVAPSDRVWVGVYSHPDDDSICFWEQNNYPLCDDNKPDFQSNFIFGI